MLFLLVFFVLLGFFSPVEILYHCNSDTVNTFWDVLSLTAVVVTPELQGRCVSCPAGWVLHPIWSDGKPYWKRPWAAAHPEFSLLGGPSVMSVPAQECGGKQGKKKSFAGELSLL